ncbi:MAG: alpha/beta hydrolase [Spirosomaceae bacterium]|nr:alpha/beta hydrolase [Spirosomataceae bacterium]
MKRLQRILFILGMLYAVAVMVSSCLTARMSDEEMNKYFANSLYSARSQYYKALGRTLHYVETGDSLRQPLLFVHGSPGSWDNFKAFLKDSSLLRHYKIMSLDRPGFGKSAEDGAETRLTDQAAALLPILKRQRQPVILVGHSYGGPVIVQAAINYPQYIKGLVVVAGSVAPELEPSNWYRYPLGYTPLRWAIPSFFRSSNDELLPLEKELRQMATQWHRVRCPVVVVQGGKDVLVAPGNAAYVQKKLPHVRVTTIWKEKMNHFVPWSDPDLILKGIFALEK